VTEILRAGLLTGVRVLVAASPGTPRFAPAIARRSAALGATVEDAVVDPEGNELALAAAGSNGSSREDESSGLGESSGSGEVFDLLVWDGSPAGSALAAIDGAWLAVRPVATQAMAGGGLIALIAPPPGDAQAAAARAGLETMARTLSIEWARLAIRPVAVLPGAGTPASEVAELVAYLASPAGAYFSGCRFELGST
jgi:NAD(P)-dependent dehydrogenase (short-subunit alcohol dehydrogenase family)